MTNPYEKIFKDSPIGSEFGNGSKLAHGLYDLDYNHHQRPRFGRLFLLGSILFGLGCIVRKLALEDPVVQLVVQQSEEAERRRQKVIDSGVNVPVSFDL